jgi:hypothetical protein
MTAMMRFLVLALLLLVTACDDGLSPGQVIPGTYTLSPVWVGNTVSAGTLTLADGGTYSLEVSRFNTATPNGLPTSLIDKNTTAGTYTFTGSDKTYQLSLSPLGVTGTLDWRAFSYSVGSTTYQWVKQSH